MISGPRCGENSVGKKTHNSPQDSQPSTSSHNSHEVRFYKTGSKEPVLEWLDSLVDEDKVRVMEVLLTVENNWPNTLGNTRFMGRFGGMALYEINSGLELLNRRSFRVFFCQFKNELVLLHVYRKQSQKTPKKELNTAIRRMKDHIGSH